MIRIAEQATARADADHWMEYQDKKHGNGNDEI
jgi:hypothetical protein